MPWPTVDRVHQVWVQLEVGDRLLPVPSSAKPSSIVWAPPRIAFELNPCPEREALLNGRAYERSPGVPCLFGAIARGQQVQLRPRGSGYSLTAEDIQTAEFAAWAYPPPPPGTPPESLEGQSVAVYTDALGPAPALVIQPNAHAIVSPDLVGQHLTLQVTYPGAVTVPMSGPRLSGVSIFAVVAVAGHPHFLRIQHAQPKVSRQIIEFPNCPEPAIVQPIPTDLPD